MVQATTTRRLQMAQLCRMGMVQFRHTRTRRFVQEILICKILNLQHAEII